MIDTDVPLIAEFLKDHQQFSRLLFEIKKQLDVGNIQTARKRAIELNEMAGGHIAYEESELYPRLEQLSKKVVSEDSLVREHHDIVDAVEKLINQSDFSDAEIAELKAEFEKSLGHAEHCGSLISLMSRLSESQQQQSLGKLRKFRKEKKKWTDL